MLKLARYIKPFTVSIVIICVLLFLQSLSQLYLPTLMADVVDKGIVSGDTGLILNIGGLMLLVAAVGTVCTVASSYLSALVSSGYGKTLREKVFQQVQSFSLEEFDKIGTASLITRTTNDITQVQHVVLMALRMIVTAPIMCIGGVIMALSRDVKLSGIFVVMLPILLTVMAIVGKKGLPLFALMQGQLDKLNLVLREGLTGIRVIRAFNRIEHEKKRFDSANRALTDTATKVFRIMSTAMPIIMLMLNFTTVVILWFGAHRIDQGNMQVGDLLAFVQYAAQIMFSLLSVAMMFVIIPRASASAQRINEVLDTKPSIFDLADSMPAQELKGCIEFRDVTFSYPGAEQPAIRNISFIAGPGEVTAIIGGTGAGKSTLIKLVPRFYDVDSGSIFIGGTDIREMSLQTLRSKVGYVPQKSMLFSGNIIENVRYGKKDATEAEVTEAAQVAQAKEFVDALDNGFEAMVAQGGTNLSGGQKQRISIARCLVRRPEIYLFDDSFSALDFKTDAKLRAALRAETANSTVLVVAQRVSTVMDADRIVVLEDGKVVGLGTHRELVNNCKVYREIIASQLTEEELA